MDAPCPGPTSPLTIDEAREVVTRIRSDDIRLQRLHDSYHVATLDNDRDLIVCRVGDFFREIAEG